MSGLTAGYVLRVSNDEYEYRVFRYRCYYVGIPRRWQPGLTVFFARKKENVDSLIGHGVVQKVEKRDTLPEEEKLECEEMGWRWKLSFDHSLERYSNPLPARETLADRYRRGRFLHGRKLQPEDVQRILQALGDHRRVITRRVV